MKCPFCDKSVKLRHRKLEVDALYKEYVCENGHKSIYRRFGDTIEVNGKTVKSAIWLSPTDRQTLEER